MIIKVPLYVEIGSVKEATDLQNLSKLISFEFYLRLRKESFEKLIKKINRLEPKSTGISELQIISIDEALESLRTKK